MAQSKNGNGQNNGPSGSTAMTSGELKWTDDQVMILIGTLKAERPDLWDAYVQGETEHDTVQRDIGQ